MRDTKSRTIPILPQLRKSVTNADRTTPKPPQYTPKPSTGVSVALIVFMLLLLIVNIAAASDRSMDPDIDGVVLTVVYLLLSVAAFPILSFFKKQAKVASRNFHFAILLALFTVNTLLIPMWNGSLLLPYILLSVGLAVNTVIAWFRRPALASGRDSFLKKFHFVMAGIGGIMMLFSLLAFLTPMNGAVRTRQTQAIHA